MMKMIMIPNHVMSRKSLWSLKYLNKTIQFKKSYVILKTIQLQSQKLKSETFDVIQIQRRNGNCYEYFSTL